MATNQPMDIVLDNIGKRFRFDWVFRQLSYTFQSGHRYAILGPNGSGKSTLMKVLSGHLTPSKGKVQFLQAQKTINPDRVYQEVSYAAPYIELIEEFTLLESIRFHQQFKPLLEGLSAEDLVALLGFEKSKLKEVRFFSSGMKQRLKLVLAICSDSSLLLLDEPTTNLDSQGMDWYRELVERFMGDRTIIVASNVEGDYGFCDERLSVLDWKKKR